MFSFLRTRISREHESRAEDKPNLSDDPLDGNLQINEERIRALFADSDDVVYRRITPHTSTDDSALVVYIEGLADREAISEQIIQPLQYHRDEESMLSRVEKSVESSELTRVSSVTDVVNAVLTGNTALLVSGSDQALIASSPGWKQRGIEASDIEPITVGPRDGFTETLRVNTAQMRRRIQSPDLKLKTLKVGARTHTQVGVMYLEGVTNPAIVDELMGRLERITIDGTFESHYLQSMIQERRWSIFPLLISTDRIDRCAQAVLDGRVIVLCDNTPFALIVPTLFWDFLSSPQDLYTNALLATFSRWLRLSSQIVSTLLPALYIAMVAFHPGLIPTRLALVILGTRQAIPFPAPVEMLIMLIAAEVLVEAATRLPRGVSQTIGVVGGILLGDAAVRAGFVSTVMIIVISLTLITAFTSPTYQLNAPRRPLRYVYIVGASILGMYGIALITLMVWIYMLTLNSFGVPYMSPVAPWRYKELVGDSVFFRAPHPNRLWRPESFDPLDPQRLPMNQEKEER